jgi:serine O-acetyltransferase
MKSPVVQSSLAYERIGGWNVKEIVSELRDARHRWRSQQHRTQEFAVREFPSREALEDVA